MEGGSERISHHTQLIRGLPDDIALSCLARVPRKYHTVLKCVSRRWRDLICSEEWRGYRQTHNLSETWMYALCRNKFQQICCYVLDPNSPRRSWKLIQGLPPRCLKRKGLGFEVLGKRIFLLGGCGWSEDASDEAYCYDISSNSWTQTASLSTARCYFACEVLNGKIYAIGGLGSKLSDPHSWDTFDPHTSSWELHSDAKIVADIEGSMVLDGKIYIRCGASTVSSRACAVVYDPSTGAWENADADMVSGWRGPAVVVDGTLYVLDQSLGTRLMMWHRDKRDWLAVMRLSPLVTKPPCQLVTIGNKIFIIGKGLSTVVFDINRIGNMEGGVMVGSSIPGLNSDDDVINCKCLSL